MQTCAHAPPHALSFTGARKKRNSRPEEASLGLPVPIRAPTLAHAHARLHTHTCKRNARLQGRGGSSGYDNAVALPAKADADEIQRLNNKTYTPSKGSAVFSVAKVDPATGEIAGVFESIQPSDTEMGAHPAKDVKVTGARRGVSAAAQGLSGGAWMGA